MVAGMGGCSNVKVGRTRGHADGLACLALKSIPDCAIGVLRFRGERESVHYAASSTPLNGLTMPATDLDTTHAAAAFQRLVAHLRTRSDVQNIELMTLGGFCRNCLADWYRESAVERGAEMTREQAREAIYGEPFSDWKARHQVDATPEQIAASHAAQARHASPER